MKMSKGNIVVCGKLGGQRGTALVLSLFLITVLTVLGTMVAAIRQRKSPFAVWRQARGYQGRSVPS